MAGKPAHIRQALNEIDNGVRLGNEDAVTAGRKRLDGAGEDGPAAVEEARARHAAATDPAVKAQSARERRATLAAQVDEATARSTSPPGRRAPEAMTTAKD